MFLVTKKNIREHWYLDEKWSFLLRFLQKTCSNLEFTPDYCMFSGEILKGKLHFSSKCDMQREIIEIRKISMVKYYRIWSPILPYKAIHSPYTEIYGTVFGSISHCDCWLWTGFAQWANTCSTSNVIFLTLNRYFPTWWLDFIFMLTNYCI